MAATLRVSSPMCRRPLGITPWGFSYAEMVDRGGIEPQRWDVESNVPPGHGPHTRLYKRTPSPHICPWKRYMVKM